MTLPDLNLLPVLHALLEERNVTRAGRRLHLSPSATSRALARLRRTTGDPLLVPEGRTMVLTPHAALLRARVADALPDVLGLLRPAPQLDLASLERTFVLRCGDGFVETFGADLVALLGRDAPAVRLRFLARTGRDLTALRDEVDLETCVFDGPPPPGVRHEPLFGDRFVVALREQHPLASAPGPLTAEQYAGAGHVHVARHGPRHGVVDDALLAAGLRRRVVTAVEGFGAGLALARSTDLVVTVPDRHTAGLRAGLRTLEVPVDLPALTVSLAWHLRQDADPAHRWLRSCVSAVAGGPPAAAAP
ncbi:LysR family transcriptional regulator [Klenkia sp. LSe6-5]|uniref:LysR family transcriptional regulator n=1 Tax=Klenkia sesuvii TaxID=3103137 RepID=A0ABU8DWH4_9ACTN